MKAKIKTLKNGLRVLTVPMPNNNTVTVLTLVATGSKYEDKKINGVSHFLEHMFFKGTKKRPRPEDVSRELDGMGAQCNAFTGLEYTGYWAKGRAKDFEKILDIVSDIYLNSTLSKNEIEKERGVITDEINMYEDLPMRKVEENLFKLMYPNQPAGMTIAGPKRNIKRISRNDFIRYKTKHYVAKGTVVVVAGGIRSGSVERRVEEKFREISTNKKQGKKKTINKQNRSLIQIEYKKTDQTHLIFGVRSYQLGHKDLPVLNVLAILFGRGMSSRLFIRLRGEMGVGYYINADQDSLTDHGIFSVSTGVVPTRAEEVVSAIIEELSRIKNEDVSKEELRKAKDFLIGNIELGLETSSAYARYFGFQAVLGQDIQSPQEKIRAIKKVMVKDIQRVTKKVFIDDKLNLSLIGPHKQNFAEKLKKILILKK